MAPLRTAQARTVRGDDWTKRTRGERLSSGPPREPREARATRPQRRAPHPLAFVWAAPRLHHSGPTDRPVDRDGPDL